jgi:protein-S-isoprenylcysteine O-methyltransferase Ste14
LLNIPFWFENPLSPLQLVSWVFLFFSLLFLVWGFKSLTKIGGTRGRIEGSENLAFENTRTLVTEGPYQYIRHPMYSSLLLLAWGAFLKHLTIQSFLVTMITSAFLVATAKTEEKENSAFFGYSYEDYIKKTKMFIPHLF